MKKVPIAFTIDNNVTMPIGVSLLSLLYNANKDTFYEIYIVHSKKYLEQKNKDLIIQSLKNYSNFSIEFVDIGDYFENAFQIRGITFTAYYRLMLHTLLPQVDTIIYSDADIIFNKDLSHVLDYDLTGYYVAGVTTDIANKENRKYISNLGLESESYINSGFMIMNLKELRDAKLDNKILEEEKKNYTFQDQDIINILFKDKIFYLHQKYNFVMDKIYNYFLLKDSKNDLHKKNQIEIEEIEETLKNLDEVIIYHYPGPNPWDYFQKDKKYGINITFEDIWWDYYKKSAFFDNDFYIYYLSQKLINCENLKKEHRKMILNGWYILGQKKGIFNKLKFLIDYLVKKFK